MQELMTLHPDQMSDRFDEVILSNQEKYEADLDALILTLTKIEKLMAGEPHRCKQLRVKAIDHYFMQRMSEKFPRISPQLFDLKRNVRLEVKGSTKATLAARILKEDETTRARVVDVECDLFALAWIGDANVPVGTYHHTKPEAWFHINANLPKGIQTAKNWARKAHAHALRIKAELLECEYLSYSDCKSIDQVSTSRGRTTEKTSGAYVTWIPKLEFLFLQEQVIPKGDPAMLYRFGDDYYLCGLWDIPEEEPGEAILREFTEGTASLK